MANARMIRKNFFEHPHIRKYTIEERYLLIGLTCASDDYGRFQFDHRLLKSMIYPTDNKQAKWISNKLKMFLDDEIICKYEVNNIEYGHFPLWFDKSFPLKQRLDHPKPEQNPDCNMHIMNEKNSRNLRESSSLNKSNINKNKINKTNASNIKSSSFAPIKVEQDETCDNEEWKEYMTQIANRLKNK